MIEKAVCAHKHFSSKPSSFERSRVLYRSVLGRGRRGQFWSKLTGGSRCLLGLRSIEANYRICTKSDVGQRTVPIAQIRGSEGRASDFDRDFNPIKDHTRQRWLGIAAAREQGKTLPPVSLVQVADLYFVKDGHHRISVARAFGQEAIEAKVMVWQVEEMLPWGISARASGCDPVGQPKGAVHTFSKLRRESVRLRDCILRRVRGLTTAIRATLEGPAAQLGLAER